MRAGMVSARKYMKTCVTACEAIGTRIRFTGQVMAEPGAGLNGGC